jgi:hypothetical protein
MDRFGRKVKQNIPKSSERGASNTPAFRAGSGAIGMPVPKTVRDKSSVLTSCVWVSRMGPLGFSFLLSSFMCRMTFRRWKRRSLVKEPD